MARKPPRSKRTFQGCKTCRIRHIKCDEARPFCGPCRQRGLDCGGYWSPLLWIGQEDVTPALTACRSKNYRGIEFRYPILSESQRQHMSSELCSSLGRWSASDLLERLDISCSRLENRGQPISGLLKGPFGAFSSSLSPSSNSSACNQGEDSSGKGLPVFNPEVTIRDCTQALMQVVADGSVEASDCASPTEHDPALPKAHENNVYLHIGEGEAGGSDSEEISYEDVESSERESWPFTMLESRELEQDEMAVSAVLSSPENFENWIASSQQLEMNPLSASNLPADITSHFDHVASEALPALTSIGGIELFSDDQASPDDVGIEPERPHLHQRNLSLFAPDLTPAARSILPDHSEPLMRHYRHQVLQVDSKGTSAWQSIFYPCALETFGELALWRTTTQTRYALLFGLLSLSAFRLHLKNDIGCKGSSWQSVAWQYQHRAQHHLRSALATETRGLGQTRYNELLMAILAVSMISLSRGSGSFDVFLLDAERLIYRQGLGNKIPTEARLLHHMYSFLRVLSESMDVTIEVPTDDPSRLFNEPPVKDGKFCLAIECYNIGLDSKQEKDPDLGYTDIHLQVQGKWNESLYPAIYGFPEILWTLLSQTVATAREKLRIEALDPPNPPLTNALRDHIQRLEKAIWAWTPTAHLFGPARPDSLSSNETRDLLDNPDSRTLAEGLHQALIIYFYRKVANVSAMVIQSNVDKALGYMETCILRIHDQDLTLCIAWATLTAATEAATPVLQAKALQLLDSINQQGIQPTNLPSKEALMAGWQQQQQ